MLQFVGGIPNYMLRSLKLKDVTLLNRLASQMRRRSIYSFLLEKVPSFNRSNPEDKAFLDLVKRLLAMDPEKRITASAALKHPFLSMTFVDE
jgi:serine/threonine protein kinase